MNDLLKAKGWTMYYSCMCGGSLKEYWKNNDRPGWEIVIRIRRQTFRILHNNKTVCGPEWGYKLEAKMAEYGI